MHSECIVNAYHLVQEAMPFHLEHIAFLISHDIKPCHRLDWILASFTNVSKVSKVVLPYKQLRSLSAIATAH